MIRQLKKNEEFWHGVQYLFWNEQEETWKSPADVGWSDSDEMQDSDQIGSFSDKVVDIFRAHGEAIVAALSAQIPNIRFIPDDADEINDVLTARTKSKIADLVSRHNKVKLVFLRALFYLAIHGTVASYRYKDSDFKYGSYKVPKYGVVEQEKIKYECPECGYESDTNWNVGQEVLANAGDSQNPPEDQITAEDIPQQNSAQISPALSCPQCGSIDKPKEEKTKEEVPTQVGEEEKPKTRAKLDVFGPLFWKVSSYARNQKECSYFILYGDIGKDIVKSNYPDYYDEIDSEQLDNTDRFSRSGFSSPSDPQEDLKYLCTVRKVWLRPAAFFRETDGELRKKLLKLFTKGARLTLVGKSKIFIDEDVIDEDLDDRWTIGQAGLSTYIYSDPILRALVEIQEMRNQLVNLIMETIAHAIPSDFADPKTLNFDTYGKFECLPGFIYKAKPATPNSRLSDSFYSSNRATLSREVALFLQQLDKDAQFCVGSFPSIYGGPSEGKSRTLGEYEASRKMALQRLSIVWTFLVEWWITTMEGLVELYTTCIVEDERFTQYSNGNYINVWIKSTELQGKTGGVESEASETFPVSLAQKQAIISKMMEMNNEYVNSVLYNPENAKVIQDFFALSELKIPGEAQRVKQCSEIQDLIRAGEAGEVPQGGMSAVAIDPNVDDHAVHIAVCRGFLVDTVGLDLAKFKPIAYAQIVAHQLQHQQALMVQTMSNVGTPAGVPPQTTQVGADE